MAYQNSPAVDPPSLYRPVGVKATQPSQVLLNVASRPPLSTSQTRIVPSSAPLARVRPSGLKTKLETPPSCPVKRRSSRPVLSSQIRTLPSSCRTGQEIVSRVERDGAADGLARDLGERLGRIRAHGAERFAMIEGVPVELRGQQHHPAEDDALDCSPSQVGPEEVRRRRRRTGKAGAAKDRGAQVRSDQYGPLEVRPRQVCTDQTGAREDVYLARKAIGAQ